MDVETPSGLTFSSSAYCTPSSRVAPLAVVETTAVKASVAPPKVAVIEALLLFRLHSGRSTVHPGFFHPCEDAIVAAAILAFETAFGPPLLIMLLIVRLLLILLLKLLLLLLRLLLSFLLMKLILFLELLLLPRWKLLL